MKRFMKIAALLLCLLLAASGCGGGGAPATGGTTTAAAPAATTAAVTTAATEAATTAAAQTSAAATAAATTAAATDAEPAASDEPPMELNGMFMQYNEPPHDDGEFWLAMEKEFNVDYTAEWVPTGTGYNQKIDLMLASGDLPEILYVANITYPSILKAIDGGAFWDITPYTLENEFAEYPNLRDHTNRDAWMWSRVKGRNYMVPRTRGTIDTGFIIRKDWVDKLGMEIPATVEEMADFAAAVGTGDLDGNGQVDSVGMFPSDGWFDDAFGGRDPVFTEDGTGLIQFRFTDAYADMVTYFRGIYERGGIAQEFALIEGQQQEEMFMSGALGAFNKNVWHTFRMQEEVKKVDPTAETYLVTHLQGPKGVANNRDLGYAGGNLFSKKNTDEEKLLKILDFMDRTSSPDYFNFLVYGVEGVHWTMVDGEPKATEKGLLEVTNSNAYPFCYAMDEFAKVKSPLATAEYNREMIDHVSVLYTIDRKVPLFNVIISDTWNVEFPMIQEEFQSMYARAISGSITMDEFKQYQKDTRELPGFQQAFKELATSYKDFF